MEATAGVSFAPATNYPIFQKKKHRVPFTPATPTEDTPRSVDPSRFSKIEVSKYVFKTREPVELDLDYPNHLFDDGEKYFGPTRYFPSLGVRPHGRGFCYISESESFSGYFVKGKPEGWGTHIRDGSVVYKGYYKEGARHGFGEKTFKQYNRTFTYKGVFQNDKFHGPGIMTCSDGRSYEGPFHEGYAIPGEGVEIFPDGRRYTGTYEAVEHGEGVMSGNGTMWFPNGDYYVGEFAEDKIKGMGSYYHSEGNIMKSGWYEERQGRITCSYKEPPTRLSGIVRELLLQSK